MLNVDDMGLVCSGECICIEDFFKLSEQSSNDDTFVILNLNKCVVAICFESDDIYYLDKLGAVLMGECYLG